MSYRTEQLKRVLDDFIFNDDQTFNTLKIKVYGTSIDSKTLNISIDELKKIIEMLED